MEQITLGAQLRTEFGKGAARKLRRAEQIPAVLYGHGIDPIALTVDSHQLKKAMSSGVKEGVLIDLNIKTDQEQKNRIVMLKELQIHPAKRYFLHADFYEIAMDRKLQVQVPVEITGTAKGVEEGGTLQIIRREIDVLGLPLDIPESIVVDVTGMQIGDSIHVEELPVPEGVEILADVNFTVVTVSSAMAAEAVEEEGEEAEGEGEEGEGAGEEDSAE